MVAQRSAIAMAEREVVDVIDQAAFDRGTFSVWRGLLIALPELQFVMKAWCFKIEIDREDPLAKARQVPSDIGDDQRTANAAFVRIEGDGLHAQVPKASSCRRLQTWSEKPSSSSAP